MKRTDNKYIFILGLLAVTCFISWNSYFKVYNQADTVNIHIFPKEIQGWVAEELPISDQDYAILETRNAFVRSYEKASGKKVFLFIVYAQNNRKVSHPPEICYTGGGVTVLDNIPEQIKVSEMESIDANKLILEQGPVQQMAYYWFKVGDSFTGNYWRQQTLIAFKNLLGKSASSALIRVSATVEHGDFQQAERNIKEFTGLILPQLYAHLP